MNPKTKVVMLGIQERKWNSLDLKIISALDIKVLTPVTKNLTALKKLNVKCDFLPFGVNLNKFKPTDNNFKKKLRLKYGLEISKKTYVHVGQITLKRNIQILKYLKSPNTQVLLVGSSSSESLNYPHDSNLIKHLEDKGIKIILDYLPDIEEVYQLADCYVFPIP